MICCRAVKVQLQLLQDIRGHVSVKTSNQFCCDHVILHYLLEKNSGIATLFDVVTTQAREGEGRISCVGGGGIPFCRRNLPSSMRGDFPLAAEWSQLVASYTTQWEVNVNLQQGENMATSQHEGHANQLDLLIRAGKKASCCFRPGPGVWTWVCF